MKRFDAIIIGTGQAGPSLAARFSTAGETVAIIERHKFGGTCVNTGCIPTERLRGPDPPLGRCGMTDAEIRKSGRRAMIAKFPMVRVSRAYEKGETQGFMKICVDEETKQILGAAILGVGGDEVIHVLLDVMYAKAPYTAIERAMHIHPTVAEYLPTVLSKLEPFA
jgi:pyruvate/2-oxoglutarate dehydrogenase complex dihydrolipoamide dehydrogenase (E3) component